MALALRVVTPPTYCTLTETSSYTGCSMQTKVCGSYMVTLHDRTPMFSGIQQDL